MEKLTIEFIKEEFKKGNYTLLTIEYKNNVQKLEYICPEGHKHSIGWNDWQKGHRCSYCVGQGKPTIEFIRKNFEKEKYKLLTKTYKNNRQKLDYICPKGHKHRVSWHVWSRNYRCPYCSGKAKKNINLVNLEFNKEGYILLTEKYKNNKQKLNYICSNGHKHRISWIKWQQGQRCPSCFFIKNVGRKHYNWKGGISCEPYCYEWYFKEFKEHIKKRDGNICLNPDCWGNISRLSVHHIDYNKKNCGQENLITLCASCNSRANKDREWHKAWYSVILQRRYNYQETTNAQ